MEIFYQPTEELATDILMKAFGRLKIENHLDYLIGENTDLSCEKKHTEKSERGVEVTTERNQNRRENIMTEGMSELCLCSILILL